GHRIKPDGGVVAPREIHRAATRLRGSQLRALVTGEQAAREVAAQMSAAREAAAPGQVGGYAYEATPRLEPGVDVTPLITWGEVAGTPLLLDPVTLAAGAPGGTAAGAAQ